MTGLSKILFALLASVSLLMFSAPTVSAATGARTAKSVKAPVKAAAKTAAQKKAKSLRAAATGKRVVRSSRVHVRLDASPRRSSVRRVAVVRAVPERASLGQLAGLRDTTDALDLKSSVALVMDQDTDEVLFSKNSEAVLPIASITKLMTAVVVTDAGLPLGELLTVSQDDVDTEKGSRSRLTVGTQLTREDMLHLALMSSENRAAHALGRHYPGGLTAFVAAMNSKALALGMTATRYVEPTGLSSLNRSSAHDLATLVKLAHAHPLISALSTSPGFLVDVGRRQLQFRNTNRLVSNPTWDIGLQKTGYISEAGRCLVMQASLAGRKLIMVFLDSSGRYTRLADAERVRKWLNATVAAKEAF